MHIRSCVMCSMLQERHEPVAYMDALYSGVTYQVTHWPTLATVLRPGTSPSRVKSPFNPFPREPVEVPSKKHKRASGNGCQRLYTLTAVIRNSLFRQRIKLSHRSDQTKVSSAAGSALQCAWRGRGTNRTAIALICMERIMEEHRMYHPGYQGIALPYCRRELFRLSCRCIVLAPSTVSRLASVKAYREYI